ncbi:hypothetical protein BKI52_03840 [marine bacterium AO1-C]|nr:hypothetical protein BKI52_03840 [marine bacterium AO1-C]
MRKSIFIKGLLVLPCLFAFTFLFAQNQENLLEKTVYLSQKEGSLLYFVKYLNELPDIHFFYDESVVPDQTIRLRHKKWKLKVLLAKLFKNTTVEHEYLSGQIILRKKKKSKVILSGTIKVDGEQLPGATVYVPELNIGSATDANGYYSLLLPPGRYRSVFSFIGHERENRTLLLNDDTSMDINLNPSINSLGEVVVSAPQKTQVELLKTAQTGVHKVDIKQLKRLPTLGGAMDILKGMQTLPGVQNATPGITNFSVRGGTYDQNLVLLDGIPVYNTAHSLGFFSAINPDAIDQVTLYKGNIPARYGGRISSIADMQTSNRLVKKFNLEGGVNFTNSQLSLNIPLGKKASLRISGRLGYPEVATGLLGLIYFFRRDAVRNQVVYTESNYADLVTSLLVNVSDKDQIKITSLYSQDVFFGREIISDRKFFWQSMGASINWRHQFNESLQGSFNLHYSNFDKKYRFQNFTDRSLAYEWLGGIQQIGGKMDFTYQVSSRSSFNFGADLTKHLFRPGKTENSRGINDTTLDNYHALESGLYFMHQLELNPKLRINYGARISGFYNIGGNKYVYDEAQNLTETQRFGTGQLMDSFFALEPRLNVHYQLTPNSTLKAAYSRNYQYLFQVNNSTVQLPSNIWLPANDNIKPRFADQFSLGYFTTLDKKGKLEFSAEAYAHFMHRVTDYRDNAHLFLNDNLATEIRTGTGQAYGLELMLRKKGKKFNGAISYTLSKVAFNIPGINQGESYAPRYDRPHNLSMNVSYELGRRWRISSTFTYMSGSNVTLPVGLIVVNNRLYNYFTKRNAFRLPYFMQWDIAITLKSRQRKRWQGEWTFGVTNVLNRRNPLAVFRDQQYYSPVDNNGRFANMFLFGWMPYVSYRFKF